MILEISDNHQKVMVEIISAGGRKKIRLGDREIQFDWVKLSDGHYSLILDSSVYDLTIDLDADACVVAGHAGMHSFRILDSRHSGIRPHMEDGPSGLRRVCAEMPGKVIRVLVKEGETVAYDQGLLILEAMKMQNEITTHVGGKVKKINVKPGDTVTKDQVMMEIER